MECKITLKDLIDDGWYVRKLQGVSGMLGQEVRRNLHSISVVNYRLREAIPNMLMRLGWLLIAVVLSVVFLIWAAKEIKAQEVFRRIPIRAIALVDDACDPNDPNTFLCCDPNDPNTLLCGDTCSGSSGIADKTKIIQSIEVANKIYDAANVQFYLRSFKRVQAPYLWCNDFPETQWRNVKNSIREAFPEVPIDAWCDNEVKGRKETGAAFRTSWWHAVTATYAPKDEISIFIRASKRSSADFPHVGRLISMANSHLGPGNTLAHELGHFLGLAHAYGPANGADPRTGQTWRKSDRWDLMYRTTPSGPQFFSSKNEAAQYENQLKLILKECDFDPNDFDPNECLLKCTLAGETIISGDPRLRLLGFQIKKDEYGVEIMGKSPRGIFCHRGLSASHYDIIWSFFDYEPPLTQEFIERVGRLPQGFTTASLAARRTRLGFLRRNWSHKTRNFCRTQGEKLYVGDFNGDSQDDLLCNSSNGSMSVDFANNKGEFWKADWSWANRNFCRTQGEKLYVGDFNGDGWDDLLCNSSNGSMSVDFANNKGEFWKADWSLTNRNFCRTQGEKLYVGDFNGDGRDDLLCNSSNGSMAVDLANDKGEFWKADWSRGNRNFCRTQGEKLYVGDFNGDGRDDLLCNSSNGSIFVDLADNKGEFWKSDWSRGGRNFCQGGGRKILVADVNGDGRDDLVCREELTGYVEIDLANSKGEFWSLQWKGALDSWCAGTNNRFLTGKFDSDDKADCLCNEATGHMNVEYSGMD